jgi:hypothetical protein
VYQGGRGCGTVVRTPMWKAIAAVVLLLAIVLGYRWWTSDERAIRKQLTAIAESLTVTPNEGSLGPVTRVAMLRRMLAPDVRVTAGPASPDGDAAGAGAHSLVGRDAVLGAASRWAAPGGVKVDFVNVRVQLSDDRGSARVSCTATTTSPGASGEPAVDARDVRIDFTRIEGAWLVSFVDVTAA